MTPIRKPTISGRKKLLRRRKSAHREFKNMIKLYGSIVSRATRNLWMLEELGVEYEHVSLDWAKQENRSPEYLKINPAGKVPLLVDGNAVMSESLGINLYLAQKFEGGLWPEADAGRALCIQWSFWAAAELEPLAYGRLREFVFKKEEERDEALVDDFAQRTGPLMTLLAQALAGGDYLVGDSFSVADLNVACVMEYLDRSDFDLPPWPIVADWYARSYGRPANTKIQKLRAPAAAAMMKQLRGE